MQNPKILKNLLFLAMFISSLNMHSCVQHASEENTLGYIDFSAEDTIPPVITLLGDNPCHILVDSSYSEPGATAYDSEDGDLTSQIITDNSSVNTSVNGVYYVTYTVSDSAGNEAEEKRRVNIVSIIDSVPPEMTLLGDNPYTIIMGSSYTEYGATAYDSVDGDLTLQIIIDTSSVITTVIGVYYVTYTVSDSAGNKTEKKRTVNVNQLADTIPPLITLLGDNPMELNVGDAYIEPGATAEDNIDGDLTSGITIDDSEVITTQEGIYRVYYAVSDAAGNKANKTRVVAVGDVVDTIAPVVTINGPNPLNLVIGDTYTEQGASAIDNFDGDITDKIETIGSVNTSVAGTYGILYQVTDSQGNKGSATRTVNVSSPGTPVITLKGDNPMNLSVGDTYVEPGATANDAEDGDLTDSIVITGTVNTSIAGTYGVLYQVTDSDTNTGSATRTVNVSSSGKPTITLLGDNPMNLIVGDTYDEPGATATDPEDGDLTGSIVISGTVNTSVAGTYGVLYQVTDSDTNTASTTRTVNVSSSGKPTITLLGDNPMNLTVGDTYVEPGATATDPEDGDLTDSIVISGTVNTSIAGTYTITYTVSDNDGNDATETRTVNVRLSDVVIVKASDKNTTVFDVTSETTFQFNDFYIMRLDLVFSEGTGTYSIDGGNDKQYQTGGMTPSEWPDDANAVTLIINPTTDTKVKFGW